MSKKRKALLTAILAVITFSQVFIVSYLAYNLGRQDGWEAHKALTTASDAAFVRQVIQKICPPEKT